MSTNKIDDLSARLNKLIRQHNSTHQEILQLKKEVLQLKKNPQLIDSSIKEEVVSTEALVTQKEPSPLVKEPLARSQTTASQPPLKERPKKQIMGDSRNLEEFIGGNLISKIGIGILIIGVGFFVKYAVDNGMLGDTVRVALGFLTGLTLTGLAYFFKEKYKNYSAILLGGGLAILYISAFAAYDFYDLIPKAMAFNLMLVFTAFGVFAAYRYDVQAIAIIGLAGAYAVPILLSDGTGNVRNLFIYMTIVNLGVLTLAFKKYWRLLNYITFVLTWGVFFSWYADRFNYEEHFTMALIFATIFFLTFYGVLLAYKLIHLEKYSFKDVAFLLTNSFVFFGAGYNLIEQIPNGEKWLGLFTISNAIVHFGVAMTVYQKKLADRNLFYLIAGLVLTFLTITFPIQLDGNWVTLIWIAEAVLVFWIGRTQKVFFYEALSYILVGMSFFSLTHDWAEGYATSIYGAEGISLMPLLNMNFFTSVFVGIGMAAIYYLHKTNSEVKVENKHDWIYKVGTFIVPMFLLIVSFFAFWVEMDHYSYQRIFQSSIEIEGSKYFNYNIEKVRKLWQFNYAFLFAALLLFVNQRFWRNKVIKFVGVGMVGLFTIAFLADGLDLLANLRSQYLSPSDQNFAPTSAGVWLRYVCYAFLGLGLFSGYNALKTEETNAKFKTYFELAMHLVILIILSAELLHLSLVIYRPEDVWLMEERIGRAGFSILWGIYALFLIVLGFWKKNKPLRLAAIALFAFTLVKVFIFDLAETSIANKTVIFLALGALLLIISFLYQRYKDVILGEEEEQKIPEEISNE